jgi:hypothetical protein
MAGPAAGYGHWTTVYNRHRRWSGDGNWVTILDEQRCDADRAEGQGWAVGTPGWGCQIFCCVSSGYLV